MNCEYYCKDHQFKGMCALYSDWKDSMPIIVYCQDTPCGDYKEIKPTYEELYEHWLKTKDKPKRKRKKKVETEQLPGQLDFFDIIDNKGE